ncbi:hypothetical protein E1258_05205 [Micromonospora sp. KC207]|uniref:hypothetical protein n=1 Tax=Micromonospora sp. KC207 TaxID=2530377 RepID=UPI0010511C5A|nr:hypothetical protein [Micromonospora sp. KC207]TDC65558.1 hypothetical protein E1258_05205 [Micromonospora sp. KC207]
MTIRVKLTLLDAGLFALSGAALLTLTYLLVRWQFARPCATPLPEDLERATAGGGSDVVVDIEEAVQADVLATASWQSAVAFAAMAAATLVLGWFTAGQAVRPVRDTGGRLSADSLGAHRLHRRPRRTGQAGVHVRRHARVDGEPNISDESAATSGDSAFVVARRANPPTDGVSARPSEHADRRRRHVPHADETELGPGPG